MEKIIVGKTYRHYKGKDYKVHGVVRHSETLEELVLYEPLYHNEEFPGELRVRPKEMFMGNETWKWEVVKRFTLISND